MDIIMLIVFLVVYGLNLYFIATENKYGYFITKLLLTPTLYHFYVSKNDNPMLTVFFALLFSFFGDLFMEFSKEEAFFTAGLGSFLIGHIFYILSFYSQINKFAVPRYLLIFLLAYIGYGIYIYRILNVQDRKLSIPVILYCGAILLMSFLALLRMKSVSTVSFILTYIGSLLFIASDSILAYNKFNKKVRHSGLWIMSTYGFAQLLIVAGL